MNELTLLDEQIPRSIKVVPRKYDLSHLKIRKQDIEKLKEINICDTIQLLIAGASQEGIARIHEETGIPKKVIYQWVSFSNLMRVYGIDNEKSELLFRLGIDTVEQLSKWDAVQLYFGLHKINLGRKARIPTKSIIMRWVRIARSLYLKKILQNIELLPEI
jgi:hypothetical protein